MDLDACPDEVAAAGLLGDLQRQAVVAHAVVVCDLAGFLNGEDVLERAADLGQKAEPSSAAATMNCALKAGRKVSAIKRLA